MYSNNNMFTFFSLEVVNLLGEYSDESENKILIARSSFHTDIYP